MVNRRNKEFSDDDIKQIANTYHKWRSLTKSEENSYQDVLGFCKSVKLDEIQANNYVLTPGRYVGNEEIEDDGISFEEKVGSLSQELKQYFEESILLQEKIKENLKRIGVEL